MCFCEPLYTLLQLRGTGAMVGENRPSGIGSRQFNAQITAVLYWARV